MFKNHSQINSSLGLTFDDVLLIPNYSEILPTQANTSTKLADTIQLKIPLLSAAMDTVTEAKLAIALAQEGGIGIIHKNLSIEQQAQKVLRVKKHESGIIRNPITINPDAKIRKVLAIKRQQNISGLPVLDNGELVGIITDRDIRFVQDMNKSVASLMSPKDKLVTITENELNQTTIEEKLHYHRIERLLIVDDNFKLSGMITVTDIKKQSSHPMAAKDSQGRLLVGAAVGTAPDTHERVEQLAKNGVDMLVVDTAHGHSKLVIDMVQWIKEHYSIPIVAGNVATAKAASQLIDAGANIIKVGIGPGSICTTRIVAGIGVPQLSAIMDVASITKHTDACLIADGGIRYSGDLAKALAAGADAVMLGSLFAGSNEAPGEIEYYNGRAFKSYRGMGSIAAMSQKFNSADRYSQIESSTDKMVPEGVEGRVAYKGSINPIIYQLIGGLKSSMGYLGCANLKQMQANAKFIQITNAGTLESHAHNVTLTKEAPNYKKNN